MGLLKFLLVTICILWVMRYVFRLLLPVMLKKMAAKFQQQATQQYHQKQYYSRPEGKIHVDYVPPKVKETKAADKAGEFVDFEEIN